MIFISSESFITHKGQYEVNEDALQIISRNIYSVSDGVGGNGNGMIASQLVTESLVTALHQNTSMTIAEALLQSEHKLDAYKRKHPKTKDMACTLALTQIQDDSIAIAWVGDSRVYQFRNGRILFKTIDHSWVSEAVQKGIISPVDALFHPNAHELTQSIKGSQHPVAIEQVRITDVKAGDYFLLCTDGILESWIDSDLEELFLITEESPYYTQKIAENCKRYSKDNYTAVVFQIGI